METNASTSIWKGKEKATNSDFEDIHTTITYRHILSHNLGVRDPLRVIALCDSDAFYAACEQVRLGIDPSEPLVVLQWQALIAVNYPARKYGISRMDNINDAKKRCPNLNVIHVATYKEGAKEPGYWPDPDTMTHKVSLDLYRRESTKVIQLFKDGVPGGEIERASIDEAFIDFTRPVREEILRRYPHLSQIPQDAPLGRDTPVPPPPPINWEGCGIVIPINPEEKADESNATSVDNNSTLYQLEQDERTWHDVALSIAAEIMDRVRKDIYAKLGYTTSAGIARNKFLAKLTASYKKPNNQENDPFTPSYNSLPKHRAFFAMQRYLTIYDQCRFKRFLGGKLGKALAKEYDVNTVGDLLTVSLEEMQRKFGEDSIWVYELLRGIDRSEVKEKPPVTKSMLAAKNLPQPITKASQGYHWIRVLAAELALRLREGREAIPALWPKSIVLHVRQGYEQHRSKQAPFPFTRDPSVDVIAAAGSKLWKELVGTDESRATPMKVSNVSLSFSGIGSMESGQRNIEGFFKPNSSDEPSTETTTKRKRESSPDALTTKTSTTSKPIGGDSFLCERCGNCIALPDELRDLDADLKQDALAALHVEHTDFHYAQELARETTPDAPKRIIRPQSSSTSTSAPSSTSKSNSKPPPKKKPKVQNGGGIARFFNKN